MQLVGRAMVLNAYLSLLRVKFRGGDIRMTAVVRICENVSEARLPGLYHLIHGAVQSRWKLMQLRRMTQHIL